MVIVVIASIIFYFAFLIYSNAHDVALALSGFAWWLLPLMFMLAMANYLLRGLKWSYYLDVLGIKLSKKRSYLIFMSGLSMSITPAKIGEVLKSYLLKKDAGTPIMTGVGIVFVERVTDLLGMMGLLCVGLIAFRYDMMPAGNLMLVGIIFVILAAVILLACNKRLVINALNFLERKKHAKKFARGMKDSYLGAHSLFGPKPLFIGFWLSFFSWSFECLCLFVALAGLGIHLNLLSVVFIFAFSSIIGAISMIPGGIGSTEASMALLLVYAGAGIALSMATATAAVILVRIATLWFAVVLGIIALMLWQRKNVEKNGKPSNQ